MLTFVWLIAGGIAGLLFAKFAGKQLKKRDLPIERNDEIVKKIRR